MQNGSMKSTLADRTAWFDRNSLFWLVQGLCWAITILIGYQVGTVTGAAAAWDERTSWFISGFRAVCGFLLTSFVLRPWLRREWRRKGYTHIFLIVLIPAGTMALLDTLILLNMLLLLGWDAVVQSFLPYLSGSYILRWILYAIWTLLYVGIHYWLDTRHAELRLARLESSLRTAELQALRAQVNPHFLFNALNSILAEADNPEAVKTLTQSLADYLRFSLKQSGEQAPLSEEWEAIANYLRVEKVRFDDRLQVEMEADPDALATQIPTACLQPLLENAIKYGQQTSPRPLRISMTATHSHDQLTIVVRNSGQWVTQSPDSTGIGLSNLKKRLKLLYHSAADVDWVEREGEVTVTIQLSLTPRSSTQI